MPHINPIVATLLTQHHIFYDRAIIIVSSHPNLASQDNERLILRRVPMDGHDCPCLHRILEPISIRIQSLMKNKIHPRPRRFLRLRTNLNQQLPPRSPSRFTPSGNKHPPLTPQSPRPYSGPRPRKMKEKPTAVQREDPHVRAKSDIFLSAERKNVFSGHQSLREQPKSAAAAIFPTIHPSGNNNPRRKRQMLTSPVGNHLHSSTLPKDQGPPPAQRTVVHPAPQCPPS